MKQLVFKLALALFVWGPSPLLYGQSSLPDQLNAFKSLLTDFKTDKYNIHHELEVLDASRGKLKYLSQISDLKGKSTTQTFEFFVGDLDPYTFIQKSKSGVLYVTGSIINRQKFIKVHTNGILDNYADDLWIMVENADVGRQVQELLTAATPLARSAKPDFNSAEDAYSWLEKNIGQAVTGSAVFEQKITFNQGKPYLAKVEVNSTNKKGEKNTETYVFSVLDLNQQGLEVEVKGTELKLNLNMVGNNRYIQYAKNTLPKDYQKDLELYFPEVETARMAFIAFETVLNRSTPTYKSISSQEQAMQILQSLVVPLQSGLDKVEQQLSYNLDAGTQLTYRMVINDSKGKTTSAWSQAYLMDLDTTTMDLLVKGKYVYVKMNTKGNQRLIRQKENGVYVRFDDELRLLVNSIDEGKEAIKALKYATKNTSGGIQTFLSAEEALAYLQTGVFGDTLNGEVYKLQVTAATKNPYKTTYSQVYTNAKGVGKSSTWHFYPYTLDAMSVEVKPSGEFLEVSVSTAVKNKFIAEEENFMHTGFTNQLEIIAFDSRQAQNIRAALIALIGFSKPESITWSSTSEAAQFVLGTIGNIKGKDGEIGQQITYWNNDSCQWQFTLTESNSKGKSTSYLLEFNLKDLSDAQVNYGIKGDNVLITLPAKGGVKTVKQTKNGSNVTFDDEVVFLVKDIDQARQLVEALAFLVRNCQ